MAYEHLALNSDISKRLAANRAASGIDPRFGSGRRTRVTAAEGLRLDKPAAATTPPAARATTAAPAAPATVSALALSLAIQAERSAVAKLFAHPGAKARIVGLCTRLASGKSAASLLAELNAGTIIADDRLRAIVAETVQASASAAWDKAYDRAFGKAAPLGPVNAKASAAWDGAIANVSRGMART